MIDIRGAIGRLRPPLGFRSCRICVFRHPELITGQTIKARHLCLMSKSTETGVTALLSFDRSSGGARKRLQQPNADFDVLPNVRYWG
jgi:hypothetical protein